MKIRMLKTMAGPEGVRQERQIYDVEDAVASGLFDAGAAEEVSEVAAARAASGAAADDDLQNEVIALKQEVETLRKENDGLKQRVEDLEKELAEKAADGGKNDGSDGKAADKIAETATDKQPGKAEHTTGKPQA